MRTFLKKLIPERIWPVFRAIDKHVVGLMYFYFGIKYWFMRKRIKLFSAARQSIPLFKVNLQFDESVGADLVSQLQQYGIRFSSGRHSAYVCGKNELSKISSEFMGRYPEPFGLKIIKSREISRDGSPFYTSRILAPASTYWSMVAVGSVLEKVVVSNLLSYEAVAPRVYDLVRLLDCKENQHFALVVEHIDGGNVYGVEGELFIDRFKKVLNKLGMRTISIREHCDLRPPEFRNNIVRDAKGARYVDIQNFVFNDEQIVGRIENGGIKILSSLDSVPKHFCGPKRRDWHDFEKSRDISGEILTLLSDLGVDYSETLIVVGADTILKGLVPVALNSGVAWCHFLNVEDSFVKWLLLKAYTRFSYGAAFGIPSQFGPDSPGNCTRVYLSSHEEINRLKFKSKNTNDFLIIESLTEEVGEIMSKTEWRYLSSSKYSYGTHGDLYYTFFSRGKCNGEE